MIGLSLSFCVADICQGKVSEEDVEVIITSTRCETEENWEELTRDYCAVYWRKFPEQAAEVLNRLRESGKLYQPRVHHNRGFYRGHDNWVTDPTDPRLDPFRNDPPLAEILGETPSVWDRAAAD